MKNTIRYIFSRLSFTLIYTVASHKAFAADGAAAIVAIAAVPQNFACQYIAFTVYYERLFFGRYRQAGILSIPVVGRQREDRSLKRTGP